MSIADVVDYVVYVVVLNLAAWLFPTVITESFWVSLLTALLLKLVLEVVTVGKDRLKSRFRNSDSRLERVLSGIGLWLVLVLSKFVVLELEALLFDDAVSLGGFVSVTLLIIVLMLARSGVRLALGQTSLAPAPPAA